MSNERKTISVENAIKNTTDELTGRVSANMIKIDGKLWEKENHKRIYFPDWMASEVASGVFTQPYNAYIDLKTGEFKCEVSSSDWNESRNNSTEQEYWEAFKTLMLAEWKK